MTESRPIEGSASDTFTISLQTYAVGFFDLLGQQERLRSLTIPNKGDPAAIARTREDIRQTYGAVRGMREIFKDSFTSFVRSRNNPADVLSPGLLALYMQMNNN